MLDTAYYAMYSIRQSGVFPMLNGASEAIWIVNLKKEY